MNKEVSLQQYTKFELKWLVMLEGTIFLVILTYLSFICFASINVVGHCLAEALEICFTKIFKAEYLIFQRSFRQFPTQFSNKIREKLQAS